jgi:hypothetical protein
MENASKSSGMSDGTKVALAIGGAALLAGIGYLVYKSTSSSSSSSSTLTSGNQSTLLGPGGSTTPLGSGNQFEAAAGTDAPLVPTGG